MKIISNFHDYYDSVLAYGVDEKRLFLRHPQEVTFDVRSMIEPIFDQGIPRLTWSRERITIEPRFLFFCGSLYIYYYLSTIEKMKRVESFAWSVGEIETFVKEYCDGRYYDKFHSKNQKKQRYHFSGRRYLFNGEFTKESFEDVLKPRSIDMDIFLQFQTPIINVKSSDRNEFGEITTNTCLKDIGFAKVKDPFTAFVELESFLSDRICSPREGEMIKIDDKIMAAKKGFGHKYAFRKEPGGK